VQAPTVTGGGITLWTCKNIKLYLNAKSDRKWNKLCECIDVDMYEKTDWHPDRLYYIDLKEWTVLLTAANNCRSSPEECLLLAPSSNRAELNQWISVPEHAHNSTTVNSRENVKCCASLCMWLRWISVSKHAHNNTAVTGTDNIQCRAGVRMWLQWI